METRDALNHSLFKNDKIQRQLTRDALMTVLNDLEMNGHLEWSDKRTKSKFLIHWKTPGQWAKIIYKYASDTGLINTVCTFYELTSGDDVRGQDFYGLDESVLRKALQELEKDRKAALISFEGSEGVKFL